MGRWGLSPGRSWQALLSSAAAGRAVGGGERRAPGAWGSTELRCAGSRLRAAQAAWEWALQAVGSPHAPQLLSSGCRALPGSGVACMQTP